MYTLQVTVTPAGTAMGWNCALCYTHQSLFRCYEALMNKLNVTLKKLVLLGIVVLLIAYVVGILYLSFFQPTSSWLKLVTSLSFTVILIFFLRRGKRAVGKHNILVFTMLVPVAVMMIVEAILSVLGAAVSSKANLLVQVITIVWAVMVFLCWRISARRT